MQLCGLLAAKLRGQITERYVVHTKQYTVIFANRELKYTSSYKVQVPKMAVNDENNQMHLIVRYSSKITHIIQMINGIVEDRKCLTIRRDKNMNYSLSVSLPF